MSNQFGTKLRELRTAAGMTQKELAEKSGRPQNTISQWENGSIEPAWSAVMDLAAALGVSCEAFRTPTDPPPEPPKRGRPKKSS